MERSSESIQLDLKTIEQMIEYHGRRLDHYSFQKGKLTMELNRARRLEREAKELQQ